MVIRQYIGISGDWNLLEYIREHVLWENLYYAVNGEGYECKRKTLFVWEMFYSVCIYCDKIKSWTANPQFKVNLQPFISSCIYVWAITIYWGALFKQKFVFTKLFLDC